jgi:hypothetical protein
MADESDKALDRLLKEAYPEVEVSADFMFRLWRRILGPVPTPRKAIPVSMLMAAIVVGVVVGIGNVVWMGHHPKVYLERLDLFGNAPYDTLAGSALIAWFGGQSRWVVGSP